MFILIENIINSLESIVANKLRSGLSMLWIIIWVASVIILSALWSWMQKSVVDNVESMWTNIISIMPWWWSNVNSKKSANNILQDDLVRYIEDNIEWLVWVLPQLSGNGQIIHESNNMNSSVVWITTNYFEVKNQWFSAELHKKLGLNTFNNINHYSLIATSYFCFRNLCNKKSNCFSFSAWHCHLSNLY